MVVDSSEDASVSKCYGKKPNPKLLKQRPVQSILKKKPAATQEQRARPEPKTSIDEAKVVKEPSKPPAAADASSVETSVIQTKTPEQTEPVGPDLPVLKRSILRSGNYELNERMTKMVETELRDIMIKVWQELPDNPSDEAEMIVVDKLRNKAGDDLRNVLGLNITKRLLNIHNPLCVKVQFSGKPEKAHLGEFLKKYHFNAFKRIENTKNSFAAKVKTIEDFDKLCSTKDVRCGGDVKVNINPIYRFPKCPPNLITNFVDKDEMPSNNTEVNVKKEEVETKTVITPEKSTITSDVVSPKSKEVAHTIENVAKVENIVASKTASKLNEKKTAVENKAVVNKATIENKTVINKAVVTATTTQKAAIENKNAGNKPAADNKIVNKPVVNTIVANKPAVENKGAVKNISVYNNTTANKSALQNDIAINKSAVAAVTKPAVAAVTKPAVAAVTKPTVENKAAVNKPAVQNKAAVNKPAVENKATVNKPAVENKATVNKPAAENKAAVSKPKVENEVVVKKPEDNKNIAAKLSPENKEGKKPVQTNVKNNVTAPKPGSVKLQTTKFENKCSETYLTKAKGVSKNTKIESDFDELDDYDILALMSEGIVLDECSGSDDE